MLQLGQVYHRRSGLDFGLDGVIELVAGEGAGEATGREIGVQVKRGLSVLTKTRYGWTLYCSSQHANYWLNHSLPIIVVHAEPGTDRLRWRHVSIDTIRKTNNGYAIDLPEDSDLRKAVDDLRALAVLDESPAPFDVAALIVPYNFADGVLVDDEELGLAALAFSRAALRGTACRVDVAMEDEADLIASIDAIRDIQAPTSAQRRDAIVREDILHRYRKHADSLRRALTLLLTEPILVEAFGYNDQLLASAIRRTAPPAMGFRIPGEIHLQAWPGYHIERPIVSFDIPPDGLDEFYERDSANRISIRMGASGGVMVLDLPADLIATRFLPNLVHALIRFADADNLADDAVLDAIGVLPSYWLVGIA